MAYLTAYVVPRQGERCTLAALQEAMGRFLPPYMMPEFFVRMASIPTTPNGKVDSQALPVVMKRGDL